MPSHDTGLRALLDVLIALAHRGEMTPEATDALFERIRRNEISDEAADAIRAQLVDTGSVFVN